MAGLGFEGFVSGPRRLTVTRHQIGDPGGSDPLRLVQLTDLHLGSVGSFHEEIAREVEALAPDVIVLTGDSVEESRALPELLSFLRLLPTGVPRFAILGNWEYWSQVDRAALEATCGRGSCQLLVDESVALGHPGGRAALLGLDDLIGGEPDMSRAARELDGDASLIVLAHCPAQRDVLASTSDIRPDAVLSGHTHGGQVAFGGVAPIIPPGSGGYVAGWYRGGGADLYVSRGLGTSVVPVRLGAPPEIALFEWYLAS